MNSNASAKNIIKLRKEPDVIIVYQEEKVAYADRKLVPGTIYKFKQTEGIAVNENEIVLKEVKKVKFGYIKQLYNENVVSSIEKVNQCGKLFIQVQHLSSKNTSIGFSLYKDKTIYLIGNDSKERGFLIHSGSGMWPSGTYTLKLREYIVPGMTLCGHRDITWTISHPVNILDLKGKVIFLHR